MDLNDYGESRYGTDPDESWWTFTNPLQSMSTILLDFGQVGASDVLYESGLSCGILTDRSAVL